ncbi:hypothetical protein ABK040_015242 [Willaertia magna]
MSNNKTTSNNTTTSSSTTSVIKTKGGEDLYVHMPDASDKEIDDLYRNEEILSKAVKDLAVGASLDQKYKANYEVILNSVSEEKSKKAKELACQFIPTYAAYFPTLSDEVINRQLDLCEESERSIRIKAIKGLPKICQYKKDNVFQIASVLSQLLKEDDQLEAQQVQDSFLELFDIDCKSSFDALLQQIANPTTTVVGESPELARERSTEFFKLVLKQKHALIDEQTENVIVKELQSLLKDTTTSNDDAVAEKKIEQFRLFLSILSRLKMFRQDGSKWMNFLRSHSPLAVENTENNLNLANRDDKFKLKKFIAFLRAAKGGMKTVKDNHPYFNYLVSVGVNQLDQLKSGENKDEDLALEIVRIMAEIADFCSESTARNYLKMVYEGFMKEIPTTTATTSESSSPSLNFSHIECFLYTFHQLAKKAPGALNETCGIKIVTGQPSDNLADFSKLREEMIQKLKTLETTTKPYLDKLNTYIKKLKEDKEKNRDEIRTQNQTRDCLDNIIQMTRALKKKTPDFIGYETLTPSWIAQRKKAKNQKRKGYNQSRGNKYQNPLKRRQYQQQGSSSSEGGRRSYSYGGGKRYDNNEYRGNRDNRDNRDYRDNRDNRDNRRSYGGQGGRGRRFNNRR